MKSMVNAIHALLTCWLVLSIAFGHPHRPIVNGVADMNSEENTFLYTTETGKTFHCQINFHLLLLLVFEWKTQFQCFAVELLLKVWKTLLG
jgi:hypothetical protein